MTLIIQPLQGCEWFAMVSTGYGLSACTRGYSYKKPYGLVEDKE
ncbi:MAG: hypothetical protein ACYSO3_06940 [Planctomycetota bacterium]